MRYLVIDRHTKQIVGSYSTLKRARNKADKLDNEYGGYRYYATAEGWNEVQS